MHLPVQVTSRDGNRVGGCAGELALSGVKVGAGAIGPPDRAMPLIEQMTDRAIAALCVEAVGAMDALHAATLDYMKTR